MDVLVAGEPEDVHQPRAHHQPVDHLGGDRDVHQQAGELARALGMRELLLQDELRQGERAFRHGASAAGSDPSDDQSDKPVTSSWARAAPTEAWIAGKEPGTKGAWLSASARVPAAFSFSIRKRNFCSS